MDISRALLIRGIVAIVFGIVTIMWPGLTIAVLVLLFGAYAFADGVAALVLGFRRYAERRWAIILHGLIGIGVGILAFTSPVTAALAFLIWIAVWAVFTGALDIFAAVRFHRELQHEWLLALSGVFSILFGLLLITMPAAGAVTLAWMLGAYTFAVGLVLVVAAARVRSLVAAA